MKLPPNVLRLVEEKNFASLATVLPDGSPHVTPMWIDREGDLILVNTAKGRVKLKNIERDPRVSICIYEQENPYNRAVILGRVVQQTTNGADAHIDKLAQKYTGAKKFVKNKLDEERIIIKIEATQVF